MGPCLARHGRYRDGRYAEPLIGFSGRGRSGERMRMSEQELEPAASAGTSVAPPGPAGRRDSAERGAARAGTGAAPAGPAGRRDGAGRGEARWAPATLEAARERVGGSLRDGGWRGARAACRETRPELAPEVVDQVGHRAFDEGAFEAL